MQEKFICPICGVLAKSEEMQNQAFLKGWCENGHGFTRAWEKSPTPPGLHEDELRQNDEYEWEHIPHLNRSKTFL